MSRDPRTTPRPSDRLRLHPVRPGAGPFDFEVLAVNPGRRLVFIKPVRLDVVADAQKLTLLADVGDLQRATVLHKAADAPEPLAGPDGWLLPPSGLSLQAIESPP